MLKLIFCEEFNVVMDAEALAETSVCLGANSPWVILGPSNMADFIVAKRGFDVNRFLGGIRNKVSNRDSHGVSFHLGFVLSVIHTYILTRALALVNTYFYFFRIYFSYPLFWAKKGNFGPNFFHGAGS